MTSGAARNELPHAAPLRARPQFDAGQQLADAGARHEAQRRPEVLADLLPAERAVPQVVRVVEVAAERVVRRRARLVIGSQEEASSAEVPVAPERRRREPRVGADQGVSPAPVGLPWVTIPPIHDCRNKFRLTRAASRFWLSGVRRSERPRRASARPARRCCSRAWRPMILAPARIGTSARRRAGRCAAMKNGQDDPRRWCARDVEHARAFQEERAFLREEQRKPRQVDLARVGLGLGEVGVDRHRGVQVRREILEDVEPASNLPSLVLLAARHVRAGCRGPGPGWMPSSPRAGPPRRGW